MLKVTACWTSVEARRGGKTAASELKTTFFSETILTLKTRF